MSELFFLSLWLWLFYCTLLTPEFITILIIVMESSRVGLLSATRRHPQFLGPLAHARRASSSSSSSRSTPCNSHEFYAFTCCRWPIWSRSFYSFFPSTSSFVPLTSSSVEPVDNVNKSTIRADTRPSSSPTRAPMNINYLLKQMDNEDR